MAAAEGAEIPKRSLIIRADALGCGRNTVVAAELRGVTPATAASRPVNQNNSIGSQLYRWYVSLDGGAFDTGNGLQDRKLIGRRRRDDC
jgi:hypothetical protein